MAAAKEWYYYCICSEGLQYSQKGGREGGKEGGKGEGGREGGGEGGGREWVKAKRK